VLAAVLAGSLLILCYLLYPLSVVLQRSVTVEGALSEDSTKRLDLGIIRSYRELRYTCCFNRVGILLIAMPLMKSTLNSGVVSTMSYLQFHIGYFISSTFSVRSQAEYSIIF